MVLYRQRTIAAKVESEKGTAETLAQADANIRAIEPNTPLSFAELERLIQESDLDKHPSITGPPIVPFNFGIEFIGSGTAGTAPGWFTAMRACALLLDDNTSDVQLDPESNNDLTETATFKLMVGDDTNALNITVKGCRGNMAMTANVGQIVRADFAMQGVLHAVENASPLARQDESTIPIYWHNAQINIGGTSFATGNYGAFTFDMGNNVEVQQDANESTTGLHYAEILDRNPRCTIDPRVVPLSTFNPYTMMQANSTDTFEIHFGETEGNRIKLTAPALQILGISEQDRQGHSVWALACKLCRSSGDDSYKFTHW